jgi:parallel beta-helix repeat protein
MRIGKTRRESSLRYLALGVALVGLPALFASSTETADLCGTTIVADFDLEEDLTCSGNALFAGADGISIRLNGHSITGNGTGVGITITGRTNVAVSGGTLRNFAAGVRTMNSTDSVVKSNLLLENTDGVDLQAGSVGTLVKENEFRDNRSRGVMLRTNSVENVVLENTLTGNNVGILLFGAINSLVKENSISSSRLAGIRINLPATGNAVVENTVTSNPSGIDFIVAADAGPAGNLVSENTIVANTCGISGIFSANTLEENVLQSNTFDIAAQLADCLAAAS